MPRPRVRWRRLTRFIISMPKRVYGVDWLVFHDGLYSEFPLHKACHFCVAFSFDVAVSSDGMG